MPAPIAELAALTWPEVAALDHGRTIALLPVGAIEAHGPHLPLDTDVIIAQAMARAAAVRLAARDLLPVLLPPIAYSPAPFAAAFAGTVSVTRDVMRDQVAAIGRSLAAHGFRRLGIANAHLDPEHLGALHAAVELLATHDDAAAGEPRVAAAANAGGSRSAAIAVAFPDLTRRAWAARLGDEFRSGACHAGRFETSIVMAERPDVVRDALRAALPAVPISLSNAIRAGQHTFAEAGGAQAYFGAPAEASAAEGRATIETLGEILEQAILEAMSGGDA